MYRTVGTLEKALAAAQLQFDDPFAFEYELAEEALREAEKTIEIVRAHWTQMPPKLRTGLNLEAQ
ncbi:MAG: hypothetical protein K6T81_17870 [Alicyclobacillus macrosporangiidus]|uniref:hypothetical protein n=1 Tax=Alicyclobacillus macrosporangiidus TaxID=392015 RepID=UPI0026E94FD8|nr:hypothetical protein [Alicyclobacillus macrosporangiidus]MCL6600576.1 hypothetical protein [Alicyclobacillus macrosporangiidus]